MRRTAGSFIFFIFVFVMLSGSKAEAIDIYTFKKDRVDQSLTGNRGYISGEPKDLPEEKRNLKRTLIGVDIELPAGFSKASSGEETATEPQKNKAKKTEKTEVKPVKEEDWIK